MVEDNKEPVFQSAKELYEKAAGYYHDLTWQERLRIANYLNSIAYNYPEDKPPRFDKTAFRTRLRNDLENLK